MSWTERRQDGGHLHLFSPPITAEEKIIPRQLAFFAGVDLQRNRIPR